MLNIEPLVPGRYSHPLPVLFATSQSRDLSIDDKITNKMVAKAAPDRNSWISSPAVSLRRTFPALSLCGGTGLDRSDVHSHLIDTVLGHASASHARRWFNSIAAILSLLSPPYSALYSPTMNYHPDLRSLPLVPSPGLGCLLSCPCLGGPNLVEETIRRPHRGRFVRREPARGGLKAAFMHRGRD